MCISSIIIIQPLLVSRGQMPDPLRTGAYQMEIIKHGAYSEEGLATQD